MPEAKRPPGSSAGAGTWRPSASLETLRSRAALYATLRAFFAARSVLEIETPVLGARTVTDPHLDSLETRVRTGTGTQTLFLQTSPEHAMKRLLAAGSGAIFQLGKAFRDAERGRRHNPEFTLLEWYRPGFDHHALMDEVDALLATTLGSRPALRITYGALFRQRLGIDPHGASERALAEAARRSDLAVQGASLDRDGWLSLLMSHVLEPELGWERPTFVHDYPASQAALARLREDRQGGTPSGAPGGAPHADEPGWVAERFEVYVEGVELANGFHELADADEQRRRFEADRAWRAAAGMPTPALDERLLAALAHGIGDCAGVALGVDRLLMLRAGADRIDEVLTFPLERA